MRAADKHLVIYRGATFAKTLYYRTIPKDSWSPALTQAELEAASSLVDNSGWTACKLYGRDDDDSSLVFSLSVGSGITLGGAAGTIALLISATDTLALTAGTGTWDMLWTKADGTVEKRLKGTYEIVDLVSYDE